MVVSVVDRHRQVRPVEWKLLEMEVDLGDIPLPHSPLRFHGSRLRELEVFHPVGADNEAIYQEFLGLTPDEIKERQDRNVI